jgi:hypothetical protein
VTRLLLLALGATLRVGCAPRQRVQRPDTWTAAAQQAEAAAQMEALVGRRMMK